MATSPVTPLSNGGPLLDRMASWCFNHRRIVVLLWILALPAMFVISSALGGKSNDAQGGNGTESSKAVEIFAREFPQGKAQTDGQAGEIVFKVDAGIASKKTQITAWLDTLAKNNIVATVTNPFTTNQPGQVSPDGTVGLSQVTFKPGVDYATEPIKLIPTAKLLRDQGVTTEFAGLPFAGFSLPPSEAFGLLAAVIILLLAFGSVIAMGLPILTAALGVGIAIAGVGIWSYFTDMPSFVTSITGMIGLGVGIDYVLFIVTRYKDELHSGLTPHAATVRAITTAGEQLSLLGSPSLSPCSACSSWASRSSTASHSLEQPRYSSSCSQPSHSFLRCSDSSATTSISGQSIADRPNQKTKKPAGIAGAAACNDEPGHSLSAALSC
jgi:putative drug exporter of the RND superfamily